MKKIKSKLNPSNIVFFLLVIIVISTQGPTYLNNLKHIGSSIEFDKINIIQNKLNLRGNNLVLFWFTSCGPCKLEMKRLKQSVKDGKIDASKVILINTFERTEVVKSFLKKNPYPFTFIEAQGLVKRLGVKVTPTTLFLTNSKIKYMSSGMSLIGVWLAEIFI